VFFDAQSAVCGVLCYVVQKHLYMESLPSQQPIKRSEPEIRKEVLEQGGFLFNFQVPTVPFENNKTFIDQWRTMERKGFFVTVDGCLLPYSYYRKSCKGDKLKGHQRSASFFFGRTPDRSIKVNQHGWPCDEQVSHLCHRIDCINPVHLVIEERWKNLKRNYCGFSGACDCGSVPKCVKTYHNNETFKESLEVERNKAKVLGLLASLHERYPFQIESKTKYLVEDEKRVNRNERKKRERKTKKLTSLNTAKRAKKASSHIGKTET
jgi:hypothetical protein